MLAQNIFPKLGKDNIIQYCIQRDVRLFWHAKYVWDNYITCSKINIYSNVHLFTGSVKVCKGSVPGVDVSLGSNCFDGGIGPGRKGVTLPLTVLKHDDTLGSTGGTSFVDS